MHVALWIPLGVVAVLFLRRGRPSDPASNTIQRDVVASIQMTLNEARVKVLGVNPEHVSPAWTELRVTGRIDDPTALAAFKWDTALELADRPYVTVASLGNVPIVLSDYRDANPKSTDLLWEYLAALRQSVTEYPA